MHLCRIALLVLTFNGSSMEVPHCGLFDAMQFIAETDHTGEGRIF
jgi:hypothetical protein